MMQAPAHRRIWTMPPPRQGPTRRPASRPPPTGTRRSICRGWRRRTAGGSAVTGYQIEVSDDGRSGWRVVQGNTRSTATTFRDSNVPPGTTLYYQVSAINNLGPGLPSNVDHATTGTRSLAPGNLTATADGDSAIDLAWAPPADTGSSAVTGYLVEVSSDAGSNWHDLAFTDATRYKHRGLGPGSTRHYRVSALNLAGRGPPSNTVHASTKGGTAEKPGAPTSLTATADGLRRSAWRGCHRPIPGVAGSPATVSKHRGTAARTGPT